MLPSRFRILAEAINTVHLISIEQYLEWRKNTLRTDPPNNQGNFNR